MRLKTAPLQKALSRLAPIAGGKMSLPILSCAKLFCANAKLYVLANNLDCAITASVECDGGLDDVCVDLKSLIAAANTNADELELTLGENKITVKGSGVCELYTADPKEFPVTPEDKFVEIGCNGEDLADMIRGASWCAIESPAEPKYEAVRIRTTPKAI